MNKALSVQELNALVSSHLNTPELQAIDVEGECSSPKLYPSGHFYFTLKDAAAAVSCVMFRSDVARQIELPKAGASIVCQGRIGLYERDGRYQMTVRNITLAGQGTLWQEFEALKIRLAHKGYFSEERKKNIPFLPKKIGIVTSSAGAAIRDIVQIIRRRFPGVSMSLFPTRVQGEGAAREIAQAIQVFNVLDQVDVLIVGRGGGSLEDLWAFNEEVVADAILDSKIPIISAVGHETDFSIADFVADLRAATPSAAAELAVPVKSDLTLQVSSLKQRLVRSLEYYLVQKEHRFTSLVQRLGQSVDKRLDNENQRLDRLSNHPVFYSPLRAVERHEEQWARLAERLGKAFSSWVDAANNSLAVLETKLVLLSPWHILERGYAAVKNGQGHYVSKAQHVKEGNRLELHFVDGVVSTEVKDVYIEKYTVEGGNNG